MGVDCSTVERVLALVPQAPPFRFLDDIVELDGNGIVGTCRYERDAWFYRGHFPGNPVTPGVILLETMAQTAVSAFGIYLLLLAGKGEEEIRGMVNLFSFAETVDFITVVRPGEKVWVRGRKIYFRRSTLKVEAAVELEDGRTAARGVLAGTAVPGL